MYSRTLRCTAIHHRRAEGTDTRSRRVGAKRNTHALAGGRFFFQVVLWDSMPIGMQTQRIRSDYLFLVTNLRLGIDLQSPRTRAA